MYEKLAKENEKLKLDLETSINLNKILEKINEITKRK